LAERTRGRLLVLFTSSDDVRRVGLDLQSFFRARRLPLLWQGMRGSAKEELAELFRSRVDATLMGVDTFWYGADFPGETLEHLVIVKLPFGVPDRYHQAQCAALGFNEQNRQIYRPRALAKLRQGFGRLMRRESDRGVVYLLDQRVLEPKHKDFLRELPLAANDAHGAGAQFVRGSTELCLQKAFAFMGLTADIRRRGLDLPFQGPVNSPLEHKRPARDEEPPPDLTHEELPF
jgi:Rad3-related DNA helicase